jgi:predicted Zn-dependent protease
MLTERDARSICDRLLGYVKADDAEVRLESDDYSHQRFAANAFTTSGSRKDVEVEVTVWIDRKRGSASTNAIDDASLKGAVEQAEQIARVSPVDREYLPTLGPQQYRPAGGYVEATAKVSLADRARTTAEIIAACEKSGVIGAGFHQARGWTEASATKNGNFYIRRASIASLAVTARTREGGGSGYFRRNHFDAARLDTARIAREAIRKALDSRDARPLGPGVYTVILEPQAVGDLLSNFPNTFQARSADEGRSAFSAPGGATKVGQRLFDERITIYSDPWHPAAPGPHASGGGLPAQKVVLVRDGVLESLVYSRFWAKEKGKEPTPGPVNTIVESAAAPVSLEEMIKGTEKGLLVTRFFYIRSVDPRTALFTGLTRDGVWYVERGEVRYPVRNFRFNQSVLEMLAPGNVEAIGEPERVSDGDFEASLMPALKIARFAFTSQSDAV